MALGRNYKVFNLGGGSAPGISRVYHDSTLSGDGTLSSLLGVVGGGGGGDIPPYPTDGYDYELRYSQTSGAYWYSPYSNPIETGCYRWKMTSLPDYMEVSSMGFTKDGLLLVDTSGFLNFNYNDYTKEFNTRSLVSANDSPSSYKNAFKYLRNLDSIDCVLDTTNSTSFESTFEGCNHLTGITPINFQNPSNVNKMFYGCSSLISVDNKLYNTQNITSLREGFKESKIENIDLELENCTDINAAFYACSNLKNAKLSNAPLMTDVGSCFRYCRSLENVTLSSMPSIENMQDAFYDCSAIKEVTLPETNSFKNMDGTFMNCYDLSAIHNLDTSNVTSMAGTFMNCYNLSSLPYLDLKNVIKMNGQIQYWGDAAYGMLEGCSSLTSIPNIDVSNKLISTDYAFHNCKNIETGISAMYGKLSGLNVTHDSTFFNCGVDTVQGKAERELVPVSWGGDGDAYNPLNLPPYTIRLKYEQGTTPTFSKGTGVLVDAEQNIWDLTYENKDWERLLYNQSNLIEVIGANSLYVKNMKSLFNMCRSLTSVSLFDTQTVTSMEDMFVCSNEFYEDGCPITSIPLFKTDSLVNVSNAFKDCWNVESGALALYQQMSTQANPPTSHRNAFSNCGRDTQTGSAELALIPSDWK